MVNTGDMMVDMVTIITLRSMMSMMTIVTMIIVMTLRVVKNLNYEVLSGFIVEH